MSMDYAAHRNVLKALQISNVKSIIQNPVDPIACLFVLCLYYFDYVFNYW